MMDFDFMGSIGWRDIIVVAAAVIGIYLLLSVMRLFKVGGKRQDSTRPPVAPPMTGWQPDFLLDATPAQPVHTAPTAPPLEFATELARSTVEVELERLRRECAQLREELARLATEVSRLKVTHNVSPLYNEAMALAQQGMPANGIAGHCGISIGEAELVAALARGASEFERHEQGEDRDDRNTQSGNRPHG